MDFCLLIILLYKDIKWVMFPFSIVILRFKFASIEKKEWRGEQLDAVGGDVLVRYWRQTPGGVEHLVSSLCGGYDVSIAWEMVTDLICSLCC